MAQPLAKYQSPRHEYDCSATQGLAAFAEDSVSGMRHGEVRLVRATHCERCAVTCTDQETGQRSPEPLRTLRSYRHRNNGYAGGVLFGAYMGVAGTATVRVGDTLAVDVHADDP